MLKKVLTCNTLLHFTTEICEYLYLLLYIGHGHKTCNILINFLQKTHHGRKKSLFVKLYDLRYMYKVINLSCAMTYT